MPRPAPAPVPGSRADVTRPRARHATPSTDAALLDLLATIPDPEIPVITITDLGIVRAATLDGTTARVAITPTYSGCPATSLIALAVESRLRDAGLTPAIETRLDPPWTTDWLTEAAHEKLRAYGIAPPTGATRPRCPRCDSPATTEISRFGSTPCKAQWRCDACAEPFDHFKCH
ncbi:1,2-phenylacetyl-CoA epoxidase subunit PaaD [Jannaschia marina]|uniref:1,2-phenylacetyl-CoA epoxidase subunit PaaD n=1 Tax=Jannaschia marina TaxID=2741674 RepID=UPI0015CC16A7|nr:1,2-phenylacetyl-CoA epoxidase subunit PaaD [Jannaschia marina]